MKALVTGARGFIGSFLVEELLKKGVEVRCLLRKKKSGFGWINGLKFQHFAGDILDLNTLKDAVMGVDYVFHLAGVTKVRNRFDFERINVGGTQNLLKTVQKYNTNIKRFILVSSLAAAGPSQNGRAVNETDKAFPISDYGKSKLKAEEIARGFNQALPISIVRPPSVFGPRDQDILSLFKFTKQGWRVFLSGGPRYASVIYVRDLVQGILLVAEKDIAINQIYYLCNDAYYSWDAFGNELAKVMNKKPRTIVIPISLAYLISFGSELFSKIFPQPGLFNLDKYQEIKATHWICDNSKAKRELDFKIKYSLQDAIKETYNWYSAKGWL